MATFLLFIVSPTPFRDFAAIRLVDLEANNPLVQASFVLAVALSGAFVGLTRPSLLPSLLRPIHLAAIAWAVVCASQSDDPALSLRRLSMAVIVITLAGAAVTLPSSLTQLSRMLAGISLLTLALCYFGVVALPNVAIHHTGDLLEPHLTGLWRGLFQHKNVSSPIMVIFIFIGMFVARVSSPPVGWAIVALAAVFLIGAGGKTAIALLPVTLLLSQLVLRARSSAKRTVVALALLGVLNLVTVGSVVIPAVQKANEAVMADPSFTGRTDIWAYGIEKVKAKPLFGYGFGTFWRTPSVISPENPEFDDVSQHGSVPAWVKLVSHSHNALVDLALAMGVPGLVLMVGWLIVAPMVDFNRVIASGGNRALALLLFRIWLFCLYLSSLESIVFDRANPVWFLMLYAMFGIGVMARYRVRGTEPEIAADEDAPSTAVAAQ